MDLAQRTRHFKDDPKTIFEFKMQSTQVKHSTSCESTYEYSPREINDIFSGSIPEDYKIPEQSNLFPTLKKVSCFVDINSIEIKLRPNEGVSLDGEE